MKKINYRFPFPSSHRPKGPDGQGWNRLAIIPLAPADRCILMPQTRQGALDTLRGMAHWGVITAYYPCLNVNADCASCGVVTRPREAWHPDWHVREDEHGGVWVLHDVTLGFNGPGVRHKSWREFMGAVDAPKLERRINQHGTYWIAAPGDAKAPAGGKKNGRRSR